jgi:hypothetical protein
MTLTTKKDFISTATNYGVKANYSGSTNTMFITGDDTKVKSFIRVCNLKGKSNYSFAIKQS